MKKIKENKKRGFSLVETLVATAIIVMATVGPLGLAGSALSQANYIKDQIVATFLAQEGLEIMRNIRDSSGLSAIAEYAISCGSGGCTVAGTELTADGKTYQVTTSSGTDRAYLKFNSDTNIYDYSGTTNSIYSRVITVEPPLNGGKEYKVRSTVSWRRGYGPRSIDLSENLFERSW